MTTPADLIAAVVDAQAAVRDAEDVVSERIRGRAEAVKVALDAGTGAQPIADALGLSRHRVYQMRDAGK